jgi:hypothetical protein
MTENPIVLHTADKILRYCPPTPLDTAEYQSMWIFVLSDNRTERYIQMSKDALKPTWVKMSVILEDVFTKALSEKEFTDELVELYLQLKGSYADINKILKKIG